MLVARSRMAPATIGPRPLGWGGRHPSGLRPVNSVQRSGCSLGSACGRAQVPRPLSRIPFDGVEYIPEGPLFSAVLKRCTQLMHTPGRGPHTYTLLASVCCCGGADRTSTTAQPAPSPSRGSRCGPGACSRSQSSPTYRGGMRPKSINNSNIPPAGPVADAQGIPPPSRKGEQRCTMHPRASGTRPPPRPRSGSSRAAHP